MGIIDPALIAFLRNFGRAQEQRGRKIVTIGSVLVNSLRRSEMIVKARRLSKS